MLFQVSVIDDIDIRQPFPLTNVLFNVSPPEVERNVSLIRDYESTSWFHRPIYRFHERPLVPFKYRIHLYLHYSIKYCRLLVQERLFTITQYLMPNTKISRQRITLHHPISNFPTQVVGFCRLGMESSSKGVVFIESLSNWQGLQEKFNHFDSEQGLILVFTCGIFLKPQTQTII